MMSELVVSTLIATRAIAILMMMVYLWSNDSGRRQRAWRLLNLLTFSGLRRTAHRMSRESSQEKEQT